MEDLKIVSRAFILGSFLWAELCSNECEIYEISYIQKAHESFTKWRTIADKSMEPGAIIRDYGSWWNLMLAGSQLVYKKLDRPTNV